MHLTLIMLKLVVPRDYGDLDCKFEISHRPVLKHVSRLHLAKEVLFTRVLFSNTNDIYHHEV